MQLTPAQKTLLNDFGWNQLQHDRYFHTDIYVLNTQSTLKHFTLHQAKYLSRVMNVLDHQVNYLTLADMFIILTATATAAKIKTADLVANVKLPDGHISDAYTLMQLLINGVSLSAKVCEGLDHVEKQDYHSNLHLSIKEIMEAVWQLCRWEESGDNGKLDVELLVRICNARLLQVELFSPQFFNLKAEMFENTELYQDWLRKYLISPTISYLKSVHSGEYHWVDDGDADGCGAINDVLCAPYKEHALRAGYVEKGLDGTITLTKEGRVHIGVERSGIID